MKSNLTEAEKKLIEKNQEYWGRRLEAILYKREEVAVKGLEKELSKLYRSTQRKIKKRVEELYVEMLEGDGVKLSSLYEKNRLEKLNIQIKKELKALGKAENKVINDTLVETYQLAFTDVAGEIGLDFAKLNKQAVEEIVHQAWSGEDFKTRIDTNKDKLLKTLDKTIKDIVILGYNKDKAIKEIMDKVGASYNSASRLVRTETMHVLNSACSHAAEKKGYKRKQVLAEIDERTCSVCSKMNGEVVPIAESILPVHPSCRCTYTIIIEDLL